MAGWYWESRDRALVAYALTVYTLNGLWNTGSSNVDGSEAHFLLLLNHDEHRRNLHCVTEQDSGAARSFESYSLGSANRFVETAKVLAEADNRFHLDEGSVVATVAHDLKKNPSLLTQISPKLVFPLVFPIITYTNKKQSKFEPCPSVIFNILICWS